MRGVGRARFGRFGAPLRGAVWLFAYLLILQSSLAPLATLRMDPAASIFGVRCLPLASDGAPASPAAHGACCDASCLLQSGNLAAPPPPEALRVGAPARVVVLVAFAPLSRRRVEPRAHGPRPQSPRAPPFA